jgi:hypothetical protein
VCRLRSHGPVLRETCASPAVSPALAAGARQMFVSGRRASGAPPLVQFRCTRPAHGLVPAVLAGLSPRGRPSLPPSAPQLSSPRIEMAKCCVLSNRGAPAGALPLHEGVTGVSASGSGVSKASEPHPAAPREPLSHRILEPWGLRAFRMF